MDIIHLSNFFRQPNALSVFIFVKRAENGCYKVNIILRLNYLNLIPARMFVYENAFLHDNLKYVKFHFTKIINLYHENSN